MSNYPKISPKKHELGGTILKKMQSNGRGLRVEVYKIGRKNSNDTPIDSPWKTEQLLWRHLMVIYYGMRGMEVWMGQTHKNDKNIQKFITFRKTDEFGKSFLNIAVEGQYFIFAS